MKEKTNTYSNITLSTKSKLSENKNLSTVDVVLVGGGVMSATLGVYLKILEPKLKIHMYERLEKIAEESSNCWNNAGTGHSAFCELNYTTISKQGSVNIDKAIHINESFEVSRQFWSYLVKNKILNNSNTFINNVPHISFVCGDDNILCLKKRFDALQTSTLFRGMDYSDDPKKIRDWIPLVMDGRDNLQKVAATKMLMGTDINFGEITQQLLLNLQKNPNFSLFLKHDVFDIKRNINNKWNIYIINNDGTQKVIQTNYIFIGCGGASLNLLQKSGIPEGNDYAGFPVGGQFLVTTKPDIVYQHNAKVYGNSPIGSPPMSVPHIDTRILNGKQAILFGPFATFSGKFLKQGSCFDLVKSFTRHNILFTLQATLGNLSLIKYLINQLVISDQSRLNLLREYYPKANIKDWYLINAGQRVQIIKKDHCKNTGVLQFGTEIVSSKDGSLSALLGASPGASTSALIMLNLLKIMFKDKIYTTHWQNKLKEILPSYGQKINGNLKLTNYIRRYTSEILGLNFIKASF
ncbi:MAG: malate dehydrogenase (quinone) [Enterobacterales bacterium]